MANGRRTPSTITTLGKLFCDCDFVEKRHCACAVAFGIWDFVWVERQRRVVLANIDMMALVFFRWLRLIADFLIK